MKLALSEAEKAKERDEVPVEAIIINQKNEIISSNGNRMRELNDPTAHAEILVIRNACKTLKTTKLFDFSLFTTLEPCAMCAQAISFSRIRRVYFGAYDYKGGGVENGARIFNQPTCHHVPEVIGGIEEEKCANLLKDFFALRRK